MIRIPEGCGGCIETQMNVLVDHAGFQGEVARVVCPLVVALTLSNEVSRQGITHFLEGEADKCVLLPEVKRLERQSPDGGRVVQMLGNLSSQAA